MNDNIESNIEFEESSLLNSIKNVTRNSNFNKIDWFNRDIVSPERLTKIYFIKSAHNIWENIIFTEKKLDINKCFKYLQYVQIFSVIITFTIFLIYCLTNIFDSFLFGCFLGSSFLLFYNYLFIGDPYELSLQQSKTFVLINIGMILISCLLVISSIIWSSLGETNHLLTIFKVSNTFLLYFNIAISVCRLNDKIITPAEYNIYEILYFIQKRGKWKEYNTCIQAAEFRTTYLKPYNIQQLYFWLLNKIRKNINENISLIILGFTSLSIATIISAIKLFIVNIKHECLIVIAMGVLASILLYPFFYINSLLGKLGRKIYTNEYEIWRSISHKMTFSLDLTTENLVKMLLPIIITVGASLVNSIFS